MPGRRALLLAVAGLMGALLAVLLLTGPRIEAEESGPIRRSGSVCLQLERWGVFGWAVVGQTYGVTDVRRGNWTSPQEPPPCDESVPEQAYMVRLPDHTPTGRYRICGLNDEEPCLEFRKIEFVPGPPGP